MPKTAIIVTAALLGVVLVFILSKENDSVALPLIVDPTCETGYELVGEGCMPLKDACELGGDGYYFDEAKQECPAR